MSTLLVVDDSEIDRRLVIGLLKENASWKIETAANGVEALARLKQSPVDLVLTDMQMPEMDGLELVKQIGIHHSQIPVILMTAHGSESLSIEALEQGAASYVPKSRLADILEESISQVLAVAVTNRNYERLVACQKRAEFAFELDNDAELIDPLVDLIQQIAFRMGMCNTNGRFRIGMALQQTILNALYHGNLELTTEQMEAARESLLGNPTANMIEKRRAASLSRPQDSHRRLHHARAARSDREGRRQGLRCRPRSIDARRRPRRPRRGPRPAPHEDPHGRSKIQRRGQRSPAREAPRASRGGLSSDGRSGREAPR